MKKKMVWKKNRIPKSIAGKAGITVRAVLCVCAALGWWGILYPELTLTPDTYRIVNEETVQNSGEMIKWDFDSNIYRDLLEAENGQIRFKSRLLQEVRGASLSKN